MTRFTAGLFALLLSLSACATVASGPRLSSANVRRIADAQVRRVMKIDLLQYEISEPHFVPGKDYWSVAYHLKADKRVAFSVRVSDKLENASINESDDGVFEGALDVKPDLH